MSVPNPAIVQAMQRASSLLQAGNFVLARATLEQILQSAPRFVEAHRLLAGALQALGDAQGAERALRNAVAIDPNWAPAQAALGEMLLSDGRREEGETALRRALSGSRPYPRAALALARSLNESARPAAALEVTAPFVGAKPPELDLLNQRAIALMALNRPDEAIDTYRRIAAAAPTSAVAELNLAAALDSAERHREAEISARRAIGKGLLTPEAHYLHARTLIATDRMDEAQSALCEAIRQRPAFVDAHTNLAQLIWMRSGDLAAASQALDRARREYPDDDALHSIKANLLEVSGDAPAAFALLDQRARSMRADTALLLGAGSLALQFDARAAQAYALRALQRAPDNVLAHRLQIDALLGLGEAGEALRIAQAQLAVRPDDQHLIAARATAWRMLGDPRYAQLCDYAQRARAWTIDTPPGWRDLDSYLRDLAAALHTLHRLHTHPLYQSLRHGSQTSQNLLHVDDPAIRAFFVAIDGPIQRHIETIGRNDPGGGEGDRFDPLRRRNSGGYRIKGIWSVRLRDQGYHTNHVHPEGWLSSACYIELPESIMNTRADSPAADPSARQGWLKFGEPGIPTQPALAPEYFIRPQPGMLALFPSYFWHGTVPFAGPDTRLTIAFDLVPA